MQCYFNFEERQHHGIKAVSFALETWQCWKVRGISLCSYLFVSEDTAGEGAEDDTATEARVNGSMPANTSSHHERPSVDCTAPGPRRRYSEDRIWPSLRV